MKKFSTTENETIKTARENHVSMSQRGLAQYIMDRMLYTYTALSGRTKAAVYSAIRRYDAAQKAATKATRTGRYSNKRSYVTA